MKMMTSISGVLVLLGTKSASKIEIKSVFCVSAGFLFDSAKNLI